MPSFYARMAGAPGRRGSFLSDVLAEPLPDPDASPSWLDTAVTTGLRVVPSVLGSVGGAIATAPTGPGAIAGAVGGGALGGGLGEWLAQQYEKARGQRAETNLGSVAVESALGAIPLGKSATLGRAALKGAGMGVAGTVGHSLSEEGDLPEVGTLGLAGGLGALLGGGGEAIGRRLSRAPVEAPAAPARVGYAAADELPVSMPTERAREASNLEWDRTAREVGHEQFASQIRQPKPTGSFWRYLDQDAAARAPAAVEPALPPEDAALADRLLGMITREPEAAAGPEVPSAFARGELDAFRTRQDAAATAERGSQDQFARSEFAALRRSLGERDAIEDRLLGGIARGPVEPPTPAPEVPSAFARGELKAFRDTLGNKRGPVWSGILSRARSEGYAGDEDALWQHYQRQMRSVRGYDSVLARSGYRARRGLESASYTPSQDLTDVVATPNWWKGLQPDADDAPSFTSELTPEITGEPGEAGFIAPELVGALGGGVTGAATGATQGETPEERAQNALLGGVAGAAGGGGLARLLSRGRGPASAADRAPALPTRDVIETPTGNLTPNRDAHVRALRFLGTDEIPPQRKQPTAQREDLGLDKFPVEQQADLRDIISSIGYDDLETQRRGVQPNERTRQLAARMALDVSTPTAPGTNLNAAGQLAYGNAVASTIDQIRTLSQRINAGGASDADLLQLGELNAAKRVLFLSHAGLRSEAGRALQIYRVLKSVMPSEMGRVRELLDSGRLRADLYDLAKLGGDLPDDPVKAYEMLRDARAMTLGEGVTNYYMSNILSGVKTQQRNILGNAAKLATRVVEKGTTGGLDALRATITGQPRQVYAREALHEVQGLFANIGKAFQDGYDTLTLGFSPTAITEADIGVGDLYTPKAEFAGGLGNPFNVPGRLLESADRVFRQLNGSMELYGLTYQKARRQAEREGLDGEAFNRFVSEKMTGMRLSPDPELRRETQRVARRAVFQENESPIINQLTALKKQVPALNFVMPFVRTVANIMKQGAEHTPLGFMMKRARQSEDLREKTIAQGEAALGSLALMPLAYYAATGRISGSGPTDPAKRAALYESGWRPNSIKVGDQWVSYTLFQPMSVPMSVVANAFEAYDEATQSGTAKGGLAYAETLVSETLARVGKSALDQSFLSGVGDLVKALEDPERAASGFVARMAQGFVPLSGLQRNIAQAIDPVVRQPEGVTESVLAGIPGASMLVQPRLDRWGEEATRTRTSALVVPEVTSANDDPVAMELARLGLDVGLPTDRLSMNELAPGARQLTAEEGFGLRQNRGRASRVILSAVMQQPGYDQLPDVLKAEMLRRVLRDGMTDVNDVARIAIQAGRPELLQQLNDPLDELAAATYAGR